MKNARQVWSHDSTAWGLIQRQIQREREEAERIDSQKTDIDRAHEAALARFHARSSCGEVSADREKINLAQQVDESNRVYLQIVDGKFQPITK